MEDLIKRLSTIVSHAEANEEDMDNVSWNYQEGILISYNDAKKIVEALKFANESKSFVYIKETDSYKPF